MTEPSPGGEPPRGFQNGWIVAALLVLISMTLAGLWILERSGRTRAQAAVQQMQQDLEKRQRGLAQLQMLPTSAEVDWSRQARRSITLDDKPREAIVISEGLGAFLGLDPDDVVIVSTDAPATSRPAQNTP